MQALHLGRRLIASVSVGLAAFSVFAAVRWFLASPRGWLRKISGFSLLLVAAIEFLPHAWGLGSKVLLLGARKQTMLSYLPSNLGIELHFVVALLFLLATGVTIREAEL